MKESTFGENLCFPYWSLIFHIFFSQFLSYCSWEFVGDPSKEYLNTRSAALFGHSSLLRGLEQSPVWQTVTVQASSCEVESTSEPLNTWKTKTREWFDSSRGLALRSVAKQPSLMMPTEISPWFNEHSSISKLLRGSFYLIFWPKLQH